MITKILMALHPGLVDTPAIERVRAIARKRTVEVMVYSAVFEEHLAGLRFGDNSELKKLRQAMIDEEVSKLQQVTAQLDTAKSVTVNVEWQYSAAEGIAAASEEFGADLIVISSTRHSALARLALTNTDWHILRQATVPVLLAHHRKFKPYKTVLAAVDPTHPNDEPAALDNELILQGRMMCDIFEGTLHLGHAYLGQSMSSSWEFTVPIDITELWKEAHCRDIDDLAELHGISSEFVHLIDGPPKVVIPKLAKSTKADLVVIGSISRRFLKELWIGHTTEHVIDHLECDVLAIRSAPGSRK